MDIEAIQKSASPWASAVVLVRKKDGSLRFCINLRKLNARTIKDAYSLPCIEEYSDCLNGAQICTSLDLKVDTDRLNCQENVPLTTFTVGPLGFYACVHMPFGLMKCTCDFSAINGNLVSGICI